MQQGDGFAMEVKCGHPGVKPGEICGLCQEKVPQPKELQTISADEVGEASWLSDLTKKDADK
jgi:hypothetical protein